MSARFIPDAAAAMLEGTPWGTAPARPLPDRDARYYALDALRTYVSLLVFSRTGPKGGSPITFQVPRERFHIEQPDDVVDQKFPSMAIVAGRGRHEYTYLGGADVHDELRDVYMPGTTVLQQAEYVEAMTLEVWGSKIPERRSLMAGLKIALAPLEEGQGLRLKLPKYYDRVAEFVLLESQYVDEPDAIRNRRRGQLYLSLRVPEVALVDAITLRPMLTLTVLDANDPYCQGTLPYRGA